MAVRVIKPGMLTTVQDSGRWGFQAHGVPVAGPMDPFSCRLANALVGNDRGAAGLEITLLGPELEFETERVIAVAGAEFDLTLDGRAVPMDAPFVASAESSIVSLLNWRWFETFNVPSMPWTLPLLPTSSILPVPHVVR